MQFQNKFKIDFTRISYLTALTLIFSYIEMILPKFLPFLKLGLSNIIILSSLSLNFSSFFLLTILKAFSNSIFSGTLFTPFFLISILQSSISGIFMFLLFKLNNLLKTKLVSLYGISIFGSILSGIIQIFSASFFLDYSIYSFLPIFIIFNLFSGILTAFFSNYLNIPQKIPEIEIKENFIQQKKNSNSKEIFFIILALTFSILIFTFENLTFLIICTILSFLIQIISKRKLKILPHLFLWIFIFLTSILTPQGKVLFSIANFSITSGALFLALIKSLQLSAISAISQSLTKLNFNSIKILSKTFFYFKLITKKLENKPLKVKTIQEAILLK